MCRFSPQRRDDLFAVISSFIEYIAPFVATLPEDRMALVDRARQVFVAHISGHEVAPVSFLRFLEDQLRYAGEFIAYRKAAIRASEKLFRRLQRISDMNDARVSRFQYFDRVIWSVDWFVSAVNSGEAWTNATGKKTFVRENGLENWCSATIKGARKHLLIVSQHWARLEMEEQRYWKLLETHAVQKRLDERAECRRSGIIDERSFRYQPIGHETEVSVTGFEVTWEEVQKAYPDVFSTRSPVQGKDLRVYLTVGMGPHIFGVDGAGAFYYMLSDVWYPYISARTLPLNV